MADANGNASGMRNALHTTQSTYERTDGLTYVLADHLGNLRVRDADERKAISMSEQRIDFEERKRRHVSIVREQLPERPAREYRVTCWLPGCGYVATSPKRIQDAWDDAVAHDREVHQGGAA